MLVKNYRQFCLDFTANSLIGDIVDVDEGVIGSDMPRRGDMSVWYLSQMIIHEQLDIKGV